jgi:polyphosphate kinase
VIVVRYQGREISWLQFNDRVLEETVDPTNPLLEQLKFLAIFSSNLDEYFMIRVSGMKGQYDLGLHTPDKKTGLTPREYLHKMLKISRDLQLKQYDIYNEKIEELSKYIKIKSYGDLKDKSREKMDSFFKNLIYPILTPITLSNYLPFPLLPNLNVYLIAKLADKKGNTQYSIITVPSNVERVVKIKKDRYILLEELIKNNINELFHGLEVEEVISFRLTRDMDLEFDDHSDDFAKSVSVELKNRKRGKVVRLEIEENASEEIVAFLKEKLDITNKFIVPINGPVDLRYLYELSSVVEVRYPELTYPIMLPVNPKVFQKPSMMEVLRKRDVMLLHPFHSYDPVVRLLRESVVDDKVVAIKMTIYRTNKDSNIMKELVKAAEKGVQVTVLFELRARFDEENNLLWGNELERAGAHVIYGVPELKTHSKLMLIVRRAQNKIERFVHFSTGNYNENNAKIYTDISYFTAKKAVGSDATVFFNYISSFGEQPYYQKLIASPNNIRNAFFKEIDQEIAYHEVHNDGHMIFKMNSITDIKMIEKIYEAAQRGVRVDLIVRGICCVNPQVEGLSENIHVRSIVGRYLEHMRVYYFHHHGDKSVYIGSADLMTRNMENRIELILPITDRLSKNKLYRLLMLQLKDNVKARENIGSEYSYVRNDLPKVNAQIETYKIVK